MSSPGTLAEIVGPWQEPAWDSSLSARCREAWTKPIDRLSRQELATLLGQKIAVPQLLPIARLKLAPDRDDDTEFYDGELAAAIAQAEK